MKTTFRLLFVPFHNVYPSKHKTFAFVQRRLNVFDFGSTLYTFYANVLCLLGCELNVS